MISIAHLLLPVWVTTAHFSGGDCIGLSIPFVPCFGLTSTIYPLMIEKVESTASPALLRPLLFQFLGRTAHGGSRPLVFLSSVRTAHGGSRPLAFVSSVRTAHGHSHLLVFVSSVMTAHGRSRPFVLEFPVRTEHGRSPRLVMCSLRSSSWSHDLVHHGQVTT